MLPVSGFDDNVSWLCFWELPQSPDVFNVLLGHEKSGSRYGYFLMVHQTSHHFHRDRSR